MWGSLTRGGRENLPGACATRDFTYLVRGPCVVHVSIVWMSELIALKPTDTDNIVSLQLIHSEFYNSIYDKGVQQNGNYDIIH